MYLTKKIKCLSRFINLSRKRIDHINIINIFLKNFFVIWKTLKKREKKIHMADVEFLFLFFNLRLLKLKKFFDSFFLRFFV